MTTNSLPLTVGMSVLFGNVKSMILFQCFTHSYKTTFLPPDVHALLLSDVFVFLSEKDQKYVFAMLVGSCCQLFFSFCLYISFSSLFLLLPSAVLCFPSSNKDLMSTARYAVVIFSYPTVVVVSISRPASFSHCEMLPASS